MTFCIAIKVEEGLVALSDTRLTSGNEVTTAQKVSMHNQGKYPLFFMTSGLRSVRDKTITYFDEQMNEAWTKIDKTYKAVNQLADQIRKVADEDKEALTQSGLAFDLHSIVGGQLKKDDEPKLFMIYPQANWVEITKETPYQIIGESGYGKSILDLALTYDSSIELALKAAFLAFDATRRCASHVDFPIDVVFYRKDSHKMFHHKYEKGDLLTVSEWWQNRIRHSLDELPDGWVKGIIEEAT